MNITDNAACCCVIVTETFAGPDPASYFMNLRLCHGPHDALKSKILKFNTFPGAVVYIYGWLAVGGKIEAHNRFNLEVPEPSGTLWIKSTIRFLLSKTFMPGATERTDRGNVPPITPAFERKRRRRRSLRNPEITPFLFHLLMRRPGSGHLQPESRFVTDGFYHNASFFNIFFKIIKQRI